MIDQLAMGGPVVMDLSVLSDLGDRADGISRWARGFVTALERDRPDLICSYLIPAGCQLSPDTVEILGSKLAVTSTHGAVPGGARVFHTMSVLDPTVPLAHAWPSFVERLGLGVAVTVHELQMVDTTPAARGSRHDRQRRRVRCGLLRNADALIASSPTTYLVLSETLGDEMPEVTVVEDATDWKETVERCSDVFEELASRAARPWRLRPRVAFVSPFPPIASGVAGYSNRLVSALDAQVRFGTNEPAAQIDCVADGLDRVPGAAVLPPGHEEPFDARWLAQAERSVGGYDEVVYVLGNSEFHSGALQALRCRPGTVIAHDVRMTGLLRLSLERSGAVPGGLRGALERAYGVEAAESLAPPDGIDVSQIDAAGLLLLGDVVGHAERLLVSSESARALAIADVKPEYGARIGVLRFAMALDPEELEVIELARTRDRPQNLLVVAFGIVDPSKLPQLLVSAVAQIRPDAHVDLAFVGPVSSALADELNLLGAELGIGQQLEITGHLERLDYLGYLARATVAVQLRAGYSGEASAAVGDCLAAGVPTIVSDIGWMGDLPEGTAVKIDTAGGGAMDRLAEALLALLDDPDRRSALSAKAASYAAGNTFAKTAAALLEALGLS